MRGEKARRESKNAAVLDRWQDVQDEDENVQSEEGRQREADRDRKLVDDAALIHKVTIFMMGRRVTLQRCS